jgi:outer membrane protein assembly factor BamC
VNHSARCGLLGLALALSACSVLESDKVDYKSATKASTLEVPPDLTQLSQESRYVVPGGPVSAAAFEAGKATNKAEVESKTAVAQIADVRIERHGERSWLVVDRPADKLWDPVRTFWQENGFNLVLDQPELGIMETDWAENRAKLPQDLIRRTIGQLLDSLYETGERDRFRTRIERRPDGTSEIYITHRGMQEVYTDERKDSTIWQPRPRDPQLEAQFLSLLMVQLGTKEEVAKAAVADAPQTPVRARELTGQPAAALEVDEPFDRAWRRIALALDRSGFTVEDRDRSGGLFYVRYIDPKLAQKEEPGFFSKLFGSDRPTPPPRYRLAVQGDGDKTRVSVLTESGAPENGEVGKRIVGVLVSQLK